MAIYLYVLSTQDFTGKSAICVALMNRMMQDGYRVGYLKPFSSGARVAQNGIDEDARLIKERFKLAEPVDILAPIVLTDKHLKQVLANGVTRDHSCRVKHAAEIVGQYNDIVVVEGGANLREGYVVDLSPVETVNLLGARVLAVVGYQHNLQIVDDALTVQNRLRDCLEGIIINLVPEEKKGYVDTLVKDYLTRHEINLVAAMPFQKLLRAVDIGELVDSLNGELICYDCLDDLVENLVVASMGIEHSIEKFRSIENKAVIVGGDRPDIQIDALETSTKALILTGSLRPTPMVEEMANLYGAAIILSPVDTLTTIERVENIFDRSRFHQLEKMKNFEKMVSESINFAQLYRHIGLS